MANLSSAKTADEIAVGMGQAALAGDPARLTTILGSCVAVTLYSPRRRVGMLSHVVLPQSRGNSENPAKYADTAVPYMLTTLKNHGVGTMELTAKVVGGACMFGDGHFAQIGETNVQATIQALEDVGIAVSSRDVHGRAGRRVCFDLATGDVSVASVGHPARII